MKVREEINKFASEEDKTILLCHGEKSPYELWEV